MPAPVSVSRSLPNHNVPKLDSLNSQPSALTLDLTLESIIVGSRRPMNTEFRIGELASRAGVTIDAVRYYERLKLLPRARRTSGNFRLFGPESIERVQFIKQAQELGFTDRKSVA